MPGDRFIIVEGKGGKMKLKKTADYDPIWDFDKDDYFDPRYFSWKDVNGDVYK